MTVASEITRLQGAKSSARTSIINKGVNVPANATVDTYHNYIDQIQQGDGGVLTGGLKLFNRRVSNKEGGPDIVGHVSWIEDNKYYGCCVCSIEGSKANSLASYVYVYVKTNSLNDMAYFLWGVSGDHSSSIFTIAKHPSFWTNGTDVKIIFFEDSSYTTNSIYCYEAIWYKNASLSSSFVGTGNTFNISDYNIDLTGYTQITTNEWVEDVTGNEIDDRAYIYLTLK